MHTAQFINDKGIHKIQKKLNEVEDLASNRSLSDDEIKAKRELQQELWEASTAYESLLRQKSIAAICNFSNCIVISFLGFSLNVIVSYTLNS